MKYLAFALTLSLSACGGAIDTTLLDGGDGGGSGKDGQSDSPGTDCNALAAQIQNAEAAATECCPTCNVQQCTQQVDGLCCPLTVTSGDSAAVKSYEAALKAFNDAKCLASCPAFACATKPSGNCMQSGSSGQCAQL